MAALGEKNPYSSWLPHTCQVHILFLLYLLIFVQLFCSESTNTCLDQLDHHAGGYPEKWVTEEQADREEGTSTQERLADICLRICLILKMFCRTIFVFLWNMQTRKIMQFWASHCQWNSILSPLLHLLTNNWKKCLFLKSAENKKNTPKKQKQNVGPNTKNKNPKPNVKHLKQRGKKLSNFGSWRAFLPRLPSPCHTGRRRAAGCSGRRPAAPWPTAGWGCGPPAPPPAAAPSASTWRRAGRAKQGVGGGGHGPLFRKAPTDSARESYLKKNKHFVELFSKVSFRSSLPKKYWVDFKKNTIIYIIIM